MIVDLSDHERDLSREDGWRCDLVISFDHLRLVRGWSWMITTTKRRVMDIRIEMVNGDVRQGTYAGKTETHIIIREQGGALRPLQMVMIKKIERKS
jgi:hypothetical protein